MKRIKYIGILVLLFVQLAAAAIRIQRVSGNVQIRRGMDENWQTAGTGMMLEDIDTILSGEASEVALLLPDGKRFILGRNAILNVGDLREISERELLLYLTAQKLRRIERTGGSPVIQIENVSVVRGEQKYAVRKRRLNPCPPGNGGRS